ncbi:MAG TPA: 2-isopropylmalate synthase [candidate division Zixibacteria bacterium]|nr:2-isopropylmalate synthase [candidate division Zixibacteria bacterium]
MAPETGGNDYVRIFDTTLRDGEQSPGASMTVEQKLVIARQLEKLGVDVIEAGFAASSEGDFEAIQRICREVKRPRILSLARAQEGDIQRALQSVEHARVPGIHVFIATSDIHLKHKLRMTREQVLEAAVKAVSYARQHLDYIEFSAEDASRSDLEFLIQVFREVIRAGASTINVPDTTGYAIPAEFGALVGNLIERTAGAERVTWSAHCHNDLGLAVANSLAAVAAGARQVECTINGIGERAGNTSLEEVVMALRTRKNYLNVDTRIVTEQIYPTSRLVSQVTGIPIPINKPIVGDNAFAHEAGIHQDGVLKHKQTYEIMTPESIGIPGNRLVMGKHSGRHAFDERLKHLGFHLSKDDMNRAFVRFKQLADKKKHVYDEDIEAIIAEEILRVPGQPDRYELLYLNVHSSSDGVPSATVKLRVAGEERMDYASGDGLVDACYKAIAKITGSNSQLVRYSVNAITGGADAQGGVSCIIEDDGMRVSGQGAHTDIIMASALAYINALNKLEGRRRYRQLVEREGP